jgi:hypothetical protein
LQNRRPHLFRNDRFWRILAIKVVAAFFRMANRTWSMCGEKRRLQLGNICFKLLSDLAQLFSPVVGSYPIKAKTSEWQLQ